MNAKLVNFTESLDLLKKADSSRTAAVICKAKRMIPLLPENTIDADVDPARTT
jgi:hypothetical protein